MLVVEVILHPERLDFGEDGSACVAFPRCGTVPVLLVILRYELVELFLGYSLLLQLGLVEAEDSRTQKGEEALNDPSIDAGVKAIHVPTPNINLAKLKVFKLCAPVLNDR